MLVYACTRCKPITLQPAACTHKSQAVSLFHILSSPAVWAGKGSRCWLLPETAQTSWRAGTWWCCTWMSWCSYSGWGERKKRKIRGTLNISVGLFWEKTLLPHTETFRCTLCHWLWPFSPPLWRHKAWNQSLKRCNVNTDNILRDKKGESRQQSTIFVDLFRNQWSWSHRWRLLDNQSHIHTHMGTNNQTN